MGDLIADGEQTVHRRLKQEAVAALTTLGYNHATAEKAIREVLSTNNNHSLEEIIKNALGELNK